MAQRGFQATIYRLPLLILAVIASLPAEPQQIAKRAADSPIQEQTSPAGGQLLNRKDVGGVLPTLLSVSGYAAMERGSEFVQPRDLLKAIYVVDLEHVSKFWDDWQGLERLAIQERLANGITQTYLNRTLYLVKVEALMEKNPGMTFEFGRPSQSLLDIVSTARDTAVKEGHDTPSSIDLLYAICIRDSELARALKASGLNTDKLAETVQSSHR